MIHSKECEEAVLATLFRMPGMIADVSAILGPDDFYIDRNGRIFAAMQALHDEGIPIDYLVVHARTSGPGLDGIEYLTGLDKYLPDLAQVLIYAEAVKDASAKRALIAIAERTIKACESARPVAEAAAVAEQGLTTLWVGVRSEWVSAKEAFEESDLIAKEQAEGNRPVIVTGLGAVDDLIGPVEAGEVVMVAGNPKMGKSSLWRHWLAVASEYGPVIAATLEEQTAQVLPKMATALAGVPWRSFRTGQMDEEEEERYWRARKSLSASKLSLIPIADPKKRFAKRLTIQKYGRLLERYKGKMGGLVAHGMDYVQLMVQGTNTNTEIEVIMNDFSWMSKHLGAVGYIVSQLNRENTLRKNKKKDGKTAWTDHVPQPSDLRGSGGLEQAVDKLVFPIRPLYFEPDNVMFQPVMGYEPAKMSIALNRNGPTGMVDVQWHGPTMAFADFTRR